ncbi:reprolysin-like metallopeptidase [Marinicella litoralis]|uniref:Reprolysin-like metallo-peptidase family M12B n=1 Tax=Marinicella litoralis TaxID=644220 RepID=A0A4R6XN48_9GAMM|nr:zinc-dependent metalloprotease family protein [Marinicella litoralis]TDR17548.1 reprolysin-like metallo-peptidase family M12B [Marinicella litoralis]
MKNIIWLLSLTPHLVFAANSNWQDISSSEMWSSVQEINVHPDKFRALELDLVAFKAQINQEMAIKKHSTVALPLPDGGVAEYQIAVYEMMEEGLKNKIPEIQTFHGFNINNPAETIYMDITPNGLHAMSLGGGKSYWIDPISQQSNGLYASYYRNDYSNKHQAWNCGVADHDHEIKSGSTRGTAPINELTLKRYRLAVAATGEYTAFHGGTVDSGLAAIVTSMVRVNGIYENELGIRMILVANNDAIVYTNSSTDPYSNNSGGAMLGQNQNNIDAVIGDANYDIGHVFSTGGGGVAYLGVPCQSGSKAGGVTGLGSPTGDVFWVDYVAHEMGHQWGGSHTFNSVTGACGGGNRSANSAYEPGSASTIQGYAGICGSDNLQNNSDPYFHARSLDQMNTYVTANAGASCANLLLTNNVAPTITVESPTGLTIPSDTPFELCADATDIDTNDNNLTYSWEQYDLGPAGSPNSPTGNAPIFRSFLASPSGCRAFPQWSDILNNTQTKGEILPSYERDLSFRMTARDNELNGGAFNTVEYAVSVAGNSGPFLVTYPNSALTFNAYDSMDVTWDVANTDSPPVSCSAVDIMMTINGGGHFFSVVSGAANDGIQNIEVPNVDSDQVRIRVQCSDHVFFDVSNSNFTIIGNDLIFEDGFESPL